MVIPTTDVLNLPDVQNLKYEIRSVQFGMLTVTCREGIEATTDQHRVTCYRTSW